MFELKSSSVYKTALKLFALQHNQQKGKKRAA